MTDQDQRLADSAIHLMAEVQSIQIDTAADALCNQRAIEQHRLSHTPILAPVCLNNGYYNKERIWWYVKTALPALSSYVTIFFTDGPARQNYLALGKTEIESEREARLQRNRLRNHVQNAATEFNLNYEDWSDIYANPVYQKHFDYIQRLFEKNQSFRNDVETDTKRVLGRQIGNETEVTPKMIAIGKDYVLQELAFLSAYPEMRGLPYVTYTYYMRWPVFERLLDGKYDSIMRDKMGFLIFRHAGFK